MGKQKLVKISRTTPVKSIKIKNQTSPDRVSWLGEAGSKIPRRA